jgi:hypothetical protein
MLKTTGGTCSGGNILVNLTLSFMSSESGLILHVRSFFFIFLKFHNMIKKSEEKS